MSEHWMRLEDGTTWPVPDDSNSDRPLGWALTYGTPTRGELLRAVSVINAYGYLVLETTRERRNQVVRELRKGVSSS